MSEENRKILLNESKGEEQKTMGKERKGEGRRKLERGKWTGKNIK